MTRFGRYALLGSLYFSQGLPFGFFTLALPVVLRARGVDLQTLGISSLLLAPWSFKVGWAPLIDRFGTRRQWIVPLQLATVVVLLGLATVDPVDEVVGLAVGMFLLALCASTQDVATDGLAVALLPEAERGFGNGLQVGAYRLGMIGGGAGIPLLYSAVGPGAAFVAMAGVLAVATVPIGLAVEPPRVRVARALVPWTVLAPLFSPRFLPWGIALALYKSGDALSGTMMKALLVDQGWTLVEIGTLLGLGGSTFGMAGALLGGALTGRLGRRSALLVFGLAQALPQAGFGRLDPVAMVLLEHALGGMATAALFTAMMDRCERPGLEATDYTVQASLVVLFTGAAGAVSGVVAERLGYLVHFPVCAMLSVLGALWAAWAVRR